MTLLAKMAATVDGISEGRLVLGSVPGSPGLEYEAYGFPDDHRVDRFAETLEIVGGLLRDAAVTTSGRFHELRNAPLRPPPDRRIPVLVAGNGPRTLRPSSRAPDARVSGGR